MLIAYFDETYKSNAEHAIVALVLPVDAVGKLEAKLDQVMTKASEESEGLQPDTELHGYELAGGEKAWKSVPIRLRHWVYERALQEIASIEDVAFCRGSVNLATKHPKDEHYWALTIALEQVNSYAICCEDRVIGICDDVTNKVAYQKMFAKARRNGTDGWYGSKLESFVDGLHFTPSCFSRMVQAADLLTYVYRRKHILPYKDERAIKANDKLWDLIQPLEDRGCSRTWA